MQVAFIAPKGLAPLSSHGDFYFILDENKEEAYGKSSKFKMLDNGVYEGKLVNIKELITLAKNLHVNEVVAIDVLKDKAKTLEGLRASIPIIKSAKMQVAATCQGKTWQEVVDCYKQIIQVEGVDTICFSKWMGRMRPYIIAHIISLGLWKPQKYNYHLFGLDYLEELDIYRRMGASIRSVDTSMPFTWAKAGATVRYFDDRKFTRVKLAGEVFTADQITLAKENMKIIKGICNGI